MDDAGVLDVSHQLLVEEEVVQGRHVRVALPLVCVGEIHTKPLPGDLQVRLDDSIVDRTAVPAITTEVRIDVAEPGDSIIFCVTDKILDDSQSLFQLWVCLTLTFTFVCWEI